MNKTYNVNLGGVPFQIDEDAYNKLLAYTNAIKGKFSGVDGSDEIVADIEARLAEMFDEKLQNTGRSIVSDDMVEKAIGIMGRPEEFDMNEESAQGTGDAAYSSSKGKSLGKRLYRDPDRKILGGVASGLSAYLGIKDPIWIRLVFILLPFLDTFLFGISTSTVILAYVILWVLLPKAITPTEKMMMRGEAVNLDNISKSVKEDWQDFKSRSETRDATSGLGRAFSLLLNIAAKFFIVIGLIIIGSILFAVLAGLFATFIAFITSMPFLNGAIFNAGWQPWTSGLGLALMLLAPIAFLIALVAKLLSKRKVPLGGIALASLGAFLVGTVLTALTAGNIAKDFRVKASVHQKDAFTPSDSLMVFTINEDSELHEGESIGLVFTDDDNDWDSNGIERYPNIYIKRSKDDQVHIKKSFSARGRTLEAARQRASGLGYNYNIFDSSRIEFDRNYHPSSELFRKQRVDVTLEIPVGQYFDLDESLRKLDPRGRYAGRDYRNYLKTGDRYKMTVDGLQKVDENFEVIPLKTSDSRHNRSDESVSIDLFGEKFLDIDVVEKGSDGEAERVQISLGGDKIVDIQVNENGDDVTIINKEADIEE